MKNRTQQLFHRYLKLDMAHRDWIVPHLLGWLDNASKRMDVSNTLDGLDSAMTLAESRQNLSPAMGTRQAGEKKE